MNEFEKSNSHLKGTGMIRRYCLFIVCILFVGLWGARSVRADVQDITVTVDAPTASPSVVCVGNYSNVTVTAHANVETITDPESNITPLKWTFTLVNVKWLATKPTDDASWASVDPAAANTYYCSLSTQTKDSSSTSNSPASSVSSTTFAFRPLISGYWHFTVSVSASYAVQDMDTGVNTNHITDPDHPATTPSTGIAVTSVGVYKVQYNNGSSWVDCPTAGYIYVVMGSNTQFRAIPTPSDTPSWPAGNPVWDWNTAGTQWGGGYSATNVYWTPTAAGYGSYTLRCRCGTSTVNVPIRAVTLVISATQPDKMTGATDFTHNCDINFTLSIYKPRGSNWMSEFGTPTWSTTGGGTPSTGSGWSFTSKFGGGSGSVTATLGVSKSLNVNLVTPSAQISVIDANNGTALQGDTVAGTLLYLGASADGFATKFAHRATWISIAMEH